MPRLREKPFRLELLLRGLPSIGCRGLAAPLPQFVDMLLNGDMTDAFDPKVDNPNSL